MGHRLELLFFQLFQFLITEQLQKLKSCNLLTLTACVFSVIELIFSSYYSIYS